MKATEDNFNEIFKPQQNHLDSNAGWDGCLYETFGEEIDFVFKVAQENPNRVWTVMEGDGNTMFYSTGFHHVNRIGFFVCEVPFEDGQEDIELEMDMFEDEDYDDEDID